MTERIRRTWRRTAAWMKCLVVFGVVIGLGAGLALAMDTDNDGMSDEFESFFGLNTASNEAALNYDGDTLDNLAESLLWTDPFVADTDNDGIQDGADSNPVSRAYIPWGDPAFTRTNDTVYTWPDWMVAAFKNGGTWQTSIPCWWVSASETGFPTLNMEVDRGLLTNDLLLLLPLTAGSNATLFMDLYDANESVIASNLGNNLLVDVGTGSVKTLSVSLSTYTNAVGIKLRRETGEVSVGETLLYVDMDGDALRDLDELRNTPDSLDATFAMSEGSDLSQDSALLPDGDSSVMLGLGDEGMMASYSFSSPGWTRRMVIAFNGYAASEALTNFPVLVVLSNNVANSGFSYEDFASTNGFDLRFTDQTLTNELSYEIEIWNTNGASCVWVRVPVLTNNANIWAYWGDSSLVVPAVYTTNGATWDSSFKAVWHMVQTNTTDSTSHHLNAASFGNTTTPGRIGGAQKFNGSAYQLVSGVYNSTRHTISAFIVPENASSGSILSCGTNNNTVFTRELQVASSNFLHRVYDGSARLVTGTTTINTGTYYHVAGVAQDSSIMRLFVNGAEEGTPISVGTMATTGDRYLVGRRFGVNGTNYFTGIIDELRIETVVRSSNWIRACWLNMASNQMFNSIGEVQNANTPPTVQSEVTPATNLVAGTNVSVSVLGADDGGETNLTYSWTATGPSGVTFTPNESNSAKDTTVCFVKAGTYWMEATIADQQCASVASSGSVTVAQTLNGLTVSPCDLTMWSGMAKAFTVNSVDQFGDSMTPTSTVIWSVSGGGTIGTDGVFTAILAGGPYTVLASNANFTASAIITVLESPTMKLPINFNGYIRPEPLTNFPALVVLSNNVAGSGFSYAQFASAAGYDLRFASEDLTNELPFEVENWNTNGASYIWVRVPILASNSYVWAHWGNTNLAATPAVYTTNGATWESSFRGVWHMTKTNTIDSTSNHLNAASFGNTNTWGQIGGAQGFNGNAYQVISDSSNLTTYTISAYVMPVNVTSGSIVDRGNNDAATYSRELRVSSSKMVHHTYDGSARAITGNTTINTGAYYHVAGVAQNSSSMRLFVNGFEDGTPISVGTMSSVGDRYLVGRRYGNTGTNYFRGIIDELRIETVIRSSNWVWAAWLNMASNQLFNSFGDVEYMTNTPPTVEMDVTPASDPVNGTNVAVSVLGDDDGGDTNLTYSWMATGPASVAFTPNDSNLAKDTTAVFTKAGVYCLQAAIIDQQWATVTSSGSVSVVQNFSGFTVHPDNATLWKGVERSFTVACHDQFGDSMMVSTSVNWSVNGGGTMTTAGVFLATTTGGPFAVMASVGECSATALVSVVMGPQAKMKISTTGYSGAEPLTNFPVLVVFSNNVGGSGFSYAEFAATNGIDLRFANAELTEEFPYEVENWNTNGASHVWVRVPVLTNNSSIWAYWGDTNLTAQPAAYTTNGATWAQGFARVWHMNGGATDSTSNRVNGTCSFVTDADGFISGASMFTSNSYMSASSSGLNGSAGTVSMVVRQDISECLSPTFIQYLFANPWPSDRLYILSTNDLLKAICKEQNYLEPTQLTLGTGTWNHVTLSWTTTNSQLWCNGSLIGTGIVDAAISWSPSVYIGSFGSSRLDGFRGLIDETRISSTVRSTNWVWAEWLNIASNTSFIAYSPVSSLAPKIAVTGSTNVSALNATIIGTVISTGASPAVVYAFWGTNSASLDFATNVGIQSIGPVSISPSGLWPEKTYFFTFMMSNDVDMVWAQTKGQFTTATSANPDEIPADWQIMYFGQTGIDPNADPDEDELSNLWEYLYGANPTNSNTDADGMLDGWEVQHGLCATNPADAIEDLDDDGYLNVYEAKHGSDPASSNSIPLPTHVVTNGMSTIQAMINSVTQDYAVVQVKAGTYTGAGNRDIAFGGKKLMLVGDGATTNTVIDCGYVCRGIVFTNGETRATVIRGFTIRKGSATSVIYGGGIACKNASPTISDCVIERNSAPNYGSGMAFFGGSKALVTGCSVISNFAAYAGSGMAVVESAPEFRNCIFAWNGVTNGAGYTTFGGGIHIGALYGEGTNSSAVFRDCSVAGNQASLGAGVYWYGAGLWLNGSISSNRSAPYYAPGSGAKLIGNISVSNALISYNWTSGVGPYPDQELGTGGGLDCAGLVRISDCAIVHNQINLGEGAGLRLSSGAVVERSLIFGNSVTNRGIGGGVVVLQGGVVRNCQIVGNTAQRGGGILMYGGIVENCYVAKNTAWPSSGGGVAISNITDSVIVRNCTIVDNSAADAGGIHLASCIALLSTNNIVQNSILWNNGPNPVGVFDGRLDMEACCVQGGYSGGSNILTSDPKLFDGYKLLGTNSPCVDAANAAYAPSDDIQGELRSFGNAPDIGCDEFVMIDSEPDGLFDGWELNYFGGLSVQPGDDPDGDFLSNLQEFNAGTDPLLPFEEDSDGDGLADGSEQVWGTDSHNQDTDGDGMRDGWEVQYGLNPLSNDSAGDADGDGVCNLAEWHWGTDPAIIDSDSDGLSDLAEISGSVMGSPSDPANPDSDGDGIPDGQDIFPNSPSGDQDGDGISDSLDSNADNDGIVSSSETYSGSYPSTNGLGTFALYPDSDGDGVPDGVDYDPDNPTVWQNPGSPDSIAPVISVVAPLEGVSL